MPKKITLVLTLILALMTPALAQPKLVKTSWEEVHKTIAEISKQIDPAKVDVILGVAVGGMVPAALFSRQLDNKNILTISLSSYTSNNEQRDIFLRNRPAKCYLEGKNVLIIDDILDSGTTIGAVKKLLLEEYNVKSVQIAAVFINTDHCQFYPDYWGIETTDWIVFPWEKFEG